MSQTPPSNGRVRGGVSPENSRGDSNNNATPPGMVVRTTATPTSLPPPSPIMAPRSRRGSQPLNNSSPPRPSSGSGSGSGSSIGGGANQSDLPPGAAPIGTVPRPSPSSNQSAAAMSVPLLASQLGRPVNFGDRGGVTSRAPLNSSTGAGPGGVFPPLNPHHLSLLSHTLSPFAAIPTGNGKFMARNINGTRKKLTFISILKSQSS